LAVYFVDTSFHVAIVDPRDDLHRRALALGRRLDAAGARLVTTDSTLVELLTFLSGEGEYARLAASAYVRRVLTDDRIEVVAQSSSLFRSALALYEQRRDQTYSMCDCMSMVVCRERGIRDVLTHDYDFVREGFSALLRR